MLTPAASSAKISESKALALTVRPRRLRQNPALRALVRENTLTPNDLVLPLFIHHGRDVRNPISSMPGHFQLSLDRLPQEIHEIVSMGIPAIMLFGIPAHKDGCGSDSTSANGIIQQALRVIKDLAPELLVMTDLCFCEYTDHGHCGVVAGEAGSRHIDNDATLELLAKQAVSHAEAGADIVAPSGMMDGMVKAIRQGLDAHGFPHLPILSYAVKYCSALYGAFRDAADCAPQFGDRRTYQMDPANGKEALREAALDVEEGADMLMVKPAGAYQDVIYQVKQAYPMIPLAAYHVSGEYAMIKAAAEKGWVDEEQVALEVLLGLKRSGADFIINYFCKDVLRWLD